MIQYDEIMVNYGELSTKGKNRKEFINCLGNNIKRSLRSFDRLNIIVNFDRIHIQLNNENYKNVISHLKNIFGIQSYSLVIKADKNIQDAKQKAIEMIRDIYHPKMTFKINTRRSDHEYLYDTNDMNRILGDAILNNFKNIKVDIHNPDIILHCEIRIDGIFLFLKKMLGAGGLPVGTSGRAMLMLSGGIDSPVAGYLAMKRGVTIEIIHFFSPPYTSLSALNKSKELTAKLSRYFGDSINFIQVPFSKIQEAIKHSIPEGYLMTVQRRFMLRIAVRIAKIRNALAVFDGESLGQVASQTLESLAAINDVTTLPILRPLISMDKNEIIDIAKKIDTFNISIQPFEDCCTIFTPPSPKTKPRISKARNYESRLNVNGLVDDAVNKIKMISISSDDHFLNFGDNLKNLL